MKKVSLLAFLCICLLFPSFAQRTMLPSNPGISIAYFGDAVVHPGFSLGFDYPLMIWENRREVPTKNGGYNRTRSAQFMTQSSLGFYNAPNDHNAILFRLEAGYRNIHHRSTFGNTAIRLDLTGGAAFVMYGGGGDGSEASPRSNLQGFRVMPLVAATLAQDYKISAYLMPISFFVKGTAMMGQGNIYPSMEIGMLFRGLFLLDNLPKKVEWTRN